MKHQASHVPVLYAEVIAGLRVTAGGCYIDCTVGAGGHAEGILQASAPNGQLLGLDADPRALEISKSTLAPFKDRATLAHSNYVYVADKARALGFAPADGVLFDLGISSIELACPERGFSFQLEGPLDMRFDPSSPSTAADLVNGLSERDLADLIYRYGEEPASRIIARAIIAARPLHTTTELANVILGAIRRRGKIHPATRTFQALRIAVNDELGSLERGLTAALSILKSEGRLAVISFHSLEDRLVKSFFAQEARDCICPPEAMICTCEHSATLDVLTRKPIRPDDDEITRNPRSRSAKLRIAIRH